MLHETPRGPLVRLRYTQNCRPSDVGSGQWECAEHVAYPVGLGALRYTCHESVICYLDVDQDRTSWGKSGYGAFRRVSTVRDEEKIAEQKKKKKKKKGKLPSPPSNGPTEETLVASPLLVVGTARCSSFCAFEISDRRLVCNTTQYNTAQVNGRVLR